MGRTRNAASRRAPARAYDFCRNTGVVWRGARLSTGLGHRSSSKSEIPTNGGQEPLASKRDPSWQLVGVEVPNGIQLVSAAAAVEGGSPGAAAPLHGAPTLPSRLVDAYVLSWLHNPAHSVLHVAPLKQAQPRFVAGTEVNFVKLTKRKFIGSVAAPSTVPRPNRACAESRSLGRHPSQARGCTRW